MSLKIVEHANQPTIALTGRLDTNTAPELDAVLNRVLAVRGVSRLVFDLSQLEYLSSAGIRCFIRARKAVEANGGKIAILNPQPAVRTVLDIVKAIPAGGVFKDMAELDAYLDAMQRKVRNPD